MKLDRYLIPSVIAGVVAGLALVISLVGLFSSEVNSPDLEEGFLVDLPEDFRDLSPEEVAELAVTLGRHLDRLDKDMDESSKLLSDRLRKLEETVVSQEDWTRWRDDLISITQDA